MIAIVDYDMGNLQSVRNALDRLGAGYTVTKDPDVIIRADKVLLPGVGNASEAMDNLRKDGLDRIIRKLRQPVLGICVGMQVMCRDSEEKVAGQEGLTGCLGIFDAHVRKFPENPEAKVPHMGWNIIGNTDSKLLSGISHDYVYFVHSFYPTLCQDTIATCRHGEIMFSAALKYENFYGTQFHPEKSSSVGARILENFIKL